MTSSIATNRWLATACPRPSARVRLFCFPYAGGGASVFRSWAEGLPDALEVCPVQLPGRESRFRERPFTRLGPLVDALLESLRPHFDCPYAFFGHSLGALLAFELARRLRREGYPGPGRLFVSACAAPQAHTAERCIHALPAAEFRDELRRLNGTPAEALGNDELMELLLPTLRADFALCETYRYASGPPLPYPITALGGLGDTTVSRRDLDAWHAQTVGSFRLRMVPGDHFFLQTARPLLLGAIAQELLDATTTAAPRRRPAWDRSEASMPVGGDAHAWRVALDPH